MKKLIRLITPPLSRAVAQSLRAGDEVEITGTIFTGRDAAHKRFDELLKNGKPLPVDLKGGILYYTGPTPANPSTGLFSAGPTTGSRMDAYTPLLLAETGLAAMIGKGDRSPAVIDAIKECGAVYFAAGGGLGALLGKRVKRSRPACYPDLGPEAVYALEVERFPVVTAIDCEGNDLYKSGPTRYRDKR
jgi:fumarate hydratase subunit beta